MFKINLTRILPNNLVKGQRFKHRWKKRYAKSETFARSFVLDPDEQIMTKGKILSKEQVFAILGEKVFKKRFSRFVGKAILYLGKFPIGSLDWYEFQKIRNGKTEFQLTWVDEGLPAA